MTAHLGLGTSQKAIVNVGVVKQTHLYRSCSMFIRSYITRNYVYRLRSITLANPWKCNWPKLYENTTRRNAKCDGTLPNASVCLLSVQIADIIYTQTADQSTKLRSVLTQALDHSGTMVFFRMAMKCPPPAVVSEFWRCMALTVWCCHVPTQRTQEYILSLPQIRLEAKLVRHVCH